MVVVLMVPHKHGDDSDGGLVLAKLPSACADLEQADNTIFFCIEHTSFKGKPQSRRSNLQAMRKDINNA